MSFRHGLPAPRWRHWSSRVKHWRRFLPWVLGSLLMAGCQAPPHERIDRFAGQQSMVRSLVTGTQFRHVVYENHRSQPGEALHIYIEGDGRPWLAGHWVAPDPTPLKPLALKLMSRDEQRAVYLGRPCYFGLHRDPGCEERYWTGARYAPVVVESMAAAARKLLKAYGDADVVLIGYSGGGTLAVLLADRIPGVTRVITVAGNLDTERWTRQHGYLPLQESLNPMQSAALAGIPHLHYAGAKDRNVEPAFIEDFSRLHSGQYQLEQNHDHGCCWVDDWPHLLQKAIRMIDNPS